MDYSQLSDFEINKCVAQIIFPEHEVKHPRELNISISPEDKSDAIVSMGYGFSFIRFVNYCNRPEDAWPIISGSKLSLINAGDGWLCIPVDTVVDGTTGDEVQMIYSSDGHVHANPLRAAMIVFLQMQDAKHV